MTDRAHVLARQAMLEDSAMHFRYAGASGFGTGSGLYRPGQDVATVALAARAFADAVAALPAGTQGAPR